MYRVEINHTKDLCFETKAGEDTLVIDTKGKGFRPPDALLASLGSCIGVYIRRYAQNSKLALEKFRILVEAEFTKEPPFCFKAIKVSVDLRGVKLDGRRQKALLEFIKNCPVHKTLEASAQVEINL